MAFQKKNKILARIRRLKRQVKYIAIRLGNDLNSSQSRIDNGKSSAGKKELAYEKSY